MTAAENKKKTTPLKTNMSCQTQSYFWETGDLVCVCVPSNNQKNTRKSSEWLYIPYHIQTLPEKVWLEPPKHTIQHQTSGGVTGGLRIDAGSSDVWFFDGFPILKTRVHGDLIKESFEG